LRGAKIDVLVNAAGSARHSAAIDTQREDYNRVIEINTRAVYFVSTAAAKKHNAS
jgi:NAD(P)-dependent dehydrogenase (short-subunit alcohol dehydrogenase family)